MTIAVDWVVKQQNKQNNKQFEPRSGPTKSGSKLFDILMVFLKEFEKSADDKKHAKLSCIMQRVITDCSQKAKIFIVLSFLSAIGLEEGTCF